MARFEGSVEERREHGQKMRALILDVMQNAGQAVGRAEILAHPNIIEAGLTKYTVASYLLMLRRDGKIHIPETNKWAIGGKATKKAKMKKLEKYADDGLKYVSPAKSGESTVVTSARIRAAVIAALENAGPMTRRDLVKRPEVTSQGLNVANISQYLYMMAKQSLVIHAHTADGRPGWALPGNAGAFETNLGNGKATKSTAHKTKPNGTGKPQQGMGLEVDQEAGTITVMVRGIPVTLKVT